MPEIHAFKTENLRHLSSLVPHCCADVAGMSLYSRIRGSRMHSASPNSQTNPTPSGLHAAMMNYLHVGPAS